MFDERSLNNKINRLHERCLRIIYNEKQSQRLNQDNSVTIHHKNIQSLAIELCETLDAAAPEIIKEVFKLREESNCNLSHIQNLLFHVLIQCIMVQKPHLFYPQEFGNLYPQTLKEKVISGFKKAIKKEA